ncbi:Uncharacterised protein [uncultured Clostridium sp.]|nr:Uncharacterised protein [uncultured Clostridium sp.]
MKIKKILLILISLTFITGCSSINNEIYVNSKNSVNVNSTSKKKNMNKKINTNKKKKKKKASKKKKNKYKTIDKFISLYEKQNNTSIADIQNMDIKGEDYRTEFRLGAFKNAIGKKGYINGYKIEMVNYGAWSRGSFRIYLTADSNENAIIIFKQLIKIIDKSITDDDVDKNINSNPAYVNFSFKNKNYITCNIIGSEIFIDTTKIKF